MGKLKREVKKRHRQVGKRMRVATVIPEPKRRIRPMTHIERLMNQPLIAMTPVLYSDLADRVPSEDDLNEIVRSFRKRPTFQMLCMLNTFLSFYDHDIPNATKVQSFLFANFIGDPLFDEAKKRFAHESVVEHPVFHRQQLLNLMKRVLVDAPADGAKDPNANENKEDRYKLGEAALMMNNLLYPKEQEEALKRRDGVNEDERIHGELFAQWLPTSELLNVPAVPNAVIRNLEYVEIFDRKFGRFAFAEGRTLSQRFEELTDIDLKRYLILLFDFYLYYEYQSNSLDELMKNPGMFNVDTETVFAKMKFSEREIAGFFDLVAADVDQLIQGLQQPSETKYPLLSHYDFTVFRKHPFVYVNDQKTVMTCIDPAFLAEKISTGAYHTILKSLEVDDDAENDKDRAERVRFLRRDWGEVFQLYVNDRIRDVFAVESRRFYDSPKWQSPKARRGKEAFDSVLDCGDALIVMEHKGKYLELSAKYSGRREALLEDLDGRFGEGVRQLAQSLEIVFNNDPAQERHTFCETNENGDVVLEYNLEAARRVKRVYPVLVVQDFSLQIGFANRELRNSFDREIANRHLDGELVRPLSLLTIEDLENLLPYLDQVSFTEVLDEYIKPHEPIFRFRHIFSQFLKRKRIEHRPNEWIDGKFDELRKSSMELFSVLD
jgi:hypothetical protein